jgi:hypothetical protein
MLRLTFFTDATWALNCFILKIGILDLTNPHNLRWNLRDTHVDLSLRDLKCYFLGIVLPLITTIIIITSLQSSGGGATEIRDAWASLSFRILRHSCFNLIQSLDAYACTCWYNRSHRWNSIFFWLSRLMMLAFCMLKNKKPIYGLHKEMNNNQFSSE